MLRKTWVMATLKVRTFHISIAHQWQLGTLASSLIAWKVISISLNAVNTPATIRCSSLLAEAA